MPFLTQNKYKKHHDHAKRSFDIEQLAISSGLAHISPELKMIIAFSSLILCLMSEYGITAFVVASVMLFITLHYGKIKKNNYWHMNAIPLSFILSSGLVLLIDVSGQKIGYIAIPIYSKYIIVTQENLKMSLTVTVKAICGITCIYMISFSTPMHEIIGVLKRCKVPQIMIEIMYLMYRFIFILIETFHNMKTAADTRLGFVNFRKSYSSLFGICMNLFVIAFQKASRSFDAMEARCYDGQLTFIEEKKIITSKQLMLTVIYLITMFLLLLLERLKIWTIF